MTVVDRAQVAALPSSVCLRVTRACNARCGFCLAPPTGHGVTFASIERRLDWLSTMGVRKVNLSGGEPTIRRDICEIVHEVDRRGLRCAMTTNGIKMPQRLVEQLVAVGAKVKISVHGPQRLHDSMLGRTCWAEVNQSLGHLHDAGVATAIQTVVTRRHPTVHEWAIEYCLSQGIRKLRLVPFVPRGRGLLMADQYQLDEDQRRALEDAVDRAHRRLRGQLDVRILDFWQREYYVLETNGEVQIQRETDAADSTVADVF